MSRNRNMLDFDFIITKFSLSFKILMEIYNFCLRYNQLRTLNKFREIWQLVSSQAP